MLKQLTPDSCHGGTQGYFLPSAPEEFKLGESQLEHACSLEGMHKGAPATLPVRSQSCAVGPAPAPRRCLGYSRVVYLLAAAELRWLLFDARPAGCLIAAGSYGRVYAGEMSQYNSTGAAQQLRPCRKQQLRLAWHRPNTRISSRALQWCSSTVQQQPRALPVSAFAAALISRCCMTLRTAAVTAASQRST